MTFEKEKVLKDFLTNILNKYFKSRSKWKLIRIFYFLFIDILQLPFDQDDKEVAESMSCTTNYPLQFEACRSLWFVLFFLWMIFVMIVPNDEDDNEDGDTVFMPIKSNDDDEPVGFKKRI